MTFAGAPRPGGFIVPRRARICPVCGGTARTARREAWGEPYFPDCPAPPEGCAATGFLVDWEKAEKEFREIAGGADA